MFRFYTTYYPETIRCFFAKISQVEQLISSGGPFKDPFEAVPGTRDLCHDGRWGRGQTSPGHGSQPQTLSRVHHRIKRGKVPRLQLAFL